MFKKRSPRFRPSLFDHLEDRAVPAGASAVAVSAGTLQSELTQAGSRVNAAFATFASGVRQLESSLIVDAPAGTTTATDPVPSTASILPQVGTLVNALASSVTTAYGGVAGASTGVAAIVGGYTSAAPSGLLGQLTQILEAPTFEVFNTPSGGLTVDATQIGLPALFSAVEGAISSAYQSTALQGFLAAAGTSTAGSSSSTPLNLTTFSTQVNSAFATLAGTVRTAELALATPANDSAVGGSPGGTLSQYLATVNSAASTLAQSLTGALAGTTGAPYAALIQDQITGGGAGSLVSRLGTLGSTQANLSDQLLFYSAVDSAISASYGGVAVDGYLIGSAVTTSTSTGSTGSSTSTGTSGTTSTTGTTGTGTSTTSASIPITVVSGNGTIITGTGGQTITSNNGSTTSTSSGVGSTGTTTTSGATGGTGTTTSSDTGGGNGSFVPTGTIGSTGTTGSTSTTGTGTTTGSGTVATSSGGGSTSVGNTTGTGGSGTGLTGIGGGTGTTDGSTVGTGTTTGTGSGTSGLGGGGTGF